MTLSPRAVQFLSALCFVFVAAGAAAVEPAPFKPVVGQAGKDVVWVPTPFSLIEKMLDMAKVTPRDFVMDLGSGDGRNIIAAAKRGARGLGVEWEKEMVEFARRVAEKEGVADRAMFVQGDMYEADISKATVLALFLLPENLDRLLPKFLALPAGTRIVLNGFAIPGWDPDETGQADGDCENWCTALLYFVPAKVTGAWRLPQGELVLEQNFQKLSGTLTVNGRSAPIRNGRLRGDRISFSAGNVQYVGRVIGDAMRGNVKSGASGTWTAVRDGAQPNADRGAAQTGS